MLKKGKNETLRRVLFIVQQDKKVILSKLQNDLELNPGNERRLGLEKLSSKFPNEFHVFAIIN